MVCQQINDIISCLDTQKSWLDPDTIIAGLSFVVAVFALYFTIREARQSQKTNKLLHRPLLDLTLDISQHEFIAVHIKNSGLGPLQYDRIEAERDGKEIKWALTNIMPSHPDGLILNFYGVSSASFLESGKSITIFKAEVAKDKSSVEKDELLKFAIQHIASLKIKVEYRSIFGEEFTFSSKIKDLLMNYT